MMIKRFVSLILAVVLVAVFILFGSFKIQLGQRGAGPYLFNLSLSFVIPPIGQPNKLLPLKTPAKSPDLATNLQILFNTIVNTAHRRSLELFQVQWVSTASNKSSDRLLK